MPRARRPSSKRSSKPRYGICDESEADDIAQHLTKMNKNAQLELATYSRHHNLPYYDKVEYDDKGYVVTPPGDHRLSDALVFLVVGQNVVPARNRHGKWPADFDTAGDVYAGRWPMGDPVIVWAHGIPFVPVYADYYAMVGGHLRKYLWLITSKTSHAKLKNDGWHLGEVVVSPKRIPATTATKTFNVDFDAYDWSNFDHVPTFNCATKRLVLLFHLGLTLTRPTNIHGFHPSAGASRNDIANRPNDIDVDTWTTWLDAPYCNTSTIKFVNKYTTKHVVTTTWRHPSDPDASGTRHHSYRVSVEANPDQSEPNQAQSATNISDDQGASNNPSNNPSSHPTSHLAVNTRDSPSDSHSTVVEAPPQQSPSVTSVTHTNTTTSDIRRMFGAFSTQLMGDCDDIDAIEDKITAIEDMRAMLDTPEAKRILQMNDDIVDCHQECDRMISCVKERLNDRDDWQKVILTTALESACSTYTTTSGDREDGSPSITQD